MTRRPIDPERLTAPAVARLLNRSEEWVHAHIADHGNGSGHLTIDGGATVPCWKDVRSGRWSFYRRHLHKAIDSLAGAA